MKPRTRKLTHDALAVAGFLTIFTLLARGQIAATVLIVVPMVFLLFGRRPRN